MQMGQANFIAAFDFFFFFFREFYGRFKIQAQAWQTTRHCITLTIHCILVLYINLTSTQLETFLVGSRHLAEAYAECGLKKKLYSIKYLFSIDIVAGF